MADEYDKAISRYLLIVEPSRLFQSVVIERCEARRLRTEIVTTAAEALAAISRQKPLAIVTSQQLSGMPGDAVIGAIRNCPQYRGIPTALLTSTQEAAESDSRVEADAVIFKGGAFKQRLDAFLGSLGVECVIGDESSVVDELNASILLAEDAAFIHKLLSRFLHVAGADVTVVENGVEALVAAGGHDLYLLDIEMPRLNGLETARQLRARGIKAPIIALSAHDDDEHDARIRSAGFDGRLTKPIDRDALLDACRKYLANAANRVVSDS